MTTGKQSINQRIVAVMRDAGAIGKDSINKQQGFNFRGIDAVMNHLHPVFAKHGVFVVPEVVTERKEERQTKSGGNLIYRVLTVRFHFISEEGDSIAATVMGEGMDSGDKAGNKAMAVALKYALTQVLLLPYDEVDPDADTPHASRPLPQPEKRERESAPAPAPQQEGETHEADITLGEVKMQTGTSKAGKPWTRYYAKGDDGQYYSTFDHKIGGAMEAASGLPARVSYAIRTGPKGESRDLLGIEPVDAQAGDATDQPAGAQDAPTPEDIGDRMRKERGLPF
jgi:hypothetical protein